MIYKLVNKYIGVNHLLTLIESKLMCCLGLFMVCRYVIEKEGKLTSITITDRFEESNVEKTIVIPIEDYTNGKELRMSVCDALAKAGYIQCNEDVKRAQDWGVWGTFVDGVTMIQLTGELEVISYNFGDVECEPEKLCDKKKVVKLQAGISKDATFTFSVGDTEKELTNGETLEADIAACFEEGQLLGSSVEDLTNFDRLTLEVCADSPRPLVNGKPLAYCGCYDLWLAAPDPCAETEKGKA